MVYNFKNISPKVDETCFIVKECVLVGDVELRQNSSVWYNAVLRGDIDKIVIGRNSNIQDGCLLHCIGGVPLEVGNNVSVGHGAVLHSCTIGDNCIIGMKAVILDNVKVGDNCIIAAGAVVAPGTVIPEGSMVMGVPAKVVRELNKEDKLAINRNAEGYLKLSAEYKESVY